ncbi:DUF523 domain-containing protein [Oscillospiraceae bacterium PP1C4]
MTLQSIQKNSIIVSDLIYVPAIIPVDYGGTFVYNVSLHLTDGTFLSRSSLELDEGGDELARMEQTIALLKQSVQKSGFRPACRYLDAAKTKTYRMLTGKPQPTCLVSACLCGESCRYDGGSNRIEPAAAMVENGYALPVCPEMNGGLPTPRPPCEISQGKVVDSNGIDRTAAFAAGARQALAVAQMFDIKHAVLKEKSPSCGSKRIYDGSFTGKVIDGQGLCAALLREHGVEIKSEEDTL